MANDIKQFAIGGVTFRSRYLLAPLAGISDSAYRRICVREGAALVYSEMVSAKALEQKNRRTNELLAFAEEEKPVAVQLFGHEPDVMARAAQMIEERDFALIDINMGCPVPKVVKNGEGSALMKDPALAAAIVTAVATATRKPVTVKMRIGFDETSINAAEFARALEAAGASAIAVHGRTREQYYAGNARREYIRAVKEAVTIPVIGNGDITDPAAGKRMFEETGCDAVMIGRGAIGNPWIFSDLIAAEAGFDLPARGWDEKEAMLMEQVRLSVEEHGEKNGICRMRGVAGRYFNGVRGAARIRDLFHRASTVEEMQGALVTARLLTESA